MTCGFSKWYNEELRNLYCYGQIKDNERVGFVALMEKNTIAYETVGGKPERTSLERARNRFKRIIILEYNFNTCCVSVLTGFI
jgi:hypothetical protein